MQTAAIRVGSGKPWYREPWPWILIAIPAASVILGVAMVVLATGTHDGLVTGDYYRQGLAINQVLEREARARALGVRANIEFDSSRTSIRAIIAGAVPQDRVLRMVLSHPTRAGLDREAVLAPDGAGAWRGQIAPLASADKWYVVVEDPRMGWRLTGTWHTADAEIVLGDTR